MPKVEMKVTVQPGEIKEIIGDDGSVTIEGIDDPELVKILQVADRMQIFNPSDAAKHHAAELELMFLVRHMSPRLKNLLKGNPLVG